jgi:hypothetical protein
MRRVFIFIVFAALFALSCQKIFFNEDEGQREINLEDFHSVRITGIYNLVLIQDSTNKLVVTGRNDINSINAVVKNDTLIISNHIKKSFNTEKNRLDLHFRTLTHLVTSDPVNVSTTGSIKTDHFLFEAIGEIAEVRLAIDCDFLYAMTSANTLGYIHFTGKANGCLLWNRYGSSMIADSLLCKEAEVYNESIGNVNVNATDNIKAFIRGPGNICYHGAPVIKVMETTGAGKLIRLD